MRKSYDTALQAVLEHEGGYVNHPEDPGGATNKGVTQKVYDAWRKRLGLRTRSVKSIEAAEVAEIYRGQYWNAIRGDELPAGVDYAAFDYAVNSGVVRAAQHLQEIAGAKVDGHIGLMTLAAVGKLKASDAVNKLCDRRMRFLRALRTFPTFGKGWTRRVSEVRAAALKSAAK